MTGRSAVARIPVHRAKMGRKPMKIKTNVKSGEGGLTVGAGVITKPIG